MTPSSIRRRLPLPTPLDLSETLGPLRRGRADPCLELSATRLRRATNTPDGSAVIHLDLDAASVTLAVEAWGPGAAWAVEHAPQLIGAEDDPADLTARLAHADAPGARLLRDLQRRHPGLRLPRSLAVVEALVPTIIEQKVIGADAWASYRSLVTARGRPAPGPAGSRQLVLPPSPGELGELAYFEFHRHGIERRRADTIRRAARMASGLDRPADVATGAVTARLATIAGIGPWTIAEVARVALGDADAVSVGDYHLPHQVAWAFLGERRSDDATMLELLEPYRPHRGRVIRLVMLSNLAPPRRAPRLARRSIRSY